MLLKLLKYKLIFLFCQFFIFLVLVGENQVFAQDDSDSSFSSDSNIYYTEFKKDLALQLFSQYKTNRLNIITEEDNLQLRPNGKASLGVAASYYGISLGISFGLPKSKESADIYGNTKQFDAQLSIYAKRFGLDGYIQSYKGYYNSNPEDFMTWNKDYYPQIPDLGVVSIGASGFYIFNHKKFSYKAPYKHTAVQHKSAGSFVLGIYGHYDDVNSDNGLIPQEFPDSIKSALNLKSFTTFTTGISYGYMYNFVIMKNFTLNLAAIPGAGYKRINQTNLDGENIVSNIFSGRIMGRFALGYEHQHFYLGLTGSATLRPLEYGDYIFDLSTEQIRFFIGRRFKL